MSDIPSRDELAAQYLDALPFEPYPMQEEALLAWFMVEQGVLVCAPTGMGKTVIAEAGLFEALHTGSKAYYTTPLIALTEQKFREMQAAAVRWGFSEDDVGLVTGHRRVNPDARVLVVVAEILFNRLLHREAFDFSDVSAVVMDEFHSFNDPERGIVWELSLGLLPAHVRTLLLSATVGNSTNFLAWLRRSHQRKLELVQSDERKVPLTYQYVPDRLLNEQIEAMTEGTADDRTTPALVFCFNREHCWTIAEQLKGKSLLPDGRQELLVEELKQHDWSQGAGPKLRQILLRGVGVHHAGLLPKYRRIVEDLFQRKLLSVATCTETLAAGINLPARSVVLPSLIKGPRGKKKVIDASSAHQIFGRAGRPQFDSRGFVFAMAHEDDVKIERWREKYNQIPENTKDPGLIKAKKKLKKKMPKRRTTEQYWNEAQFDKLRAAPPRNLASRGPLPWRLLAYMLDASPEVALVRDLVGKRLMEQGELDSRQRSLDEMLLTLWKAGYVTLDPPPPKQTEAPEETPADAEPPPPYRALRAEPTPALERLIQLRTMHPLYGVFLANQLGIADPAERIQAFESVLEIPPAVAYHLRVPKQDVLPPGPLATMRLDGELLQLGLATAEELAQSEEKEDDHRGRQFFDEERKWVLTIGEKLKLLFDHEFPAVDDLRIQPVWAAGELLEFGGDFNKFIVARSLQKQEGIVFRHLLRLVLLLAEMKQIPPPDLDPADWRTELTDLAERLTASCRQVDATSTDKTLEQIEADEDAC